MTIPLFIVDAFADRPFSGNPAAVCLLDGPRPAGWMQQVAAEMNLSETAFLHPELEGPAGCLRLRWFTPLAEVDLCGHATLASATALLAAGEVPPGRPIEFQTRSGLLTATPAGDGFELDFPALHTHVCEPPPGLSESLDLGFTFVGHYGLDYLCETDDEAALRAARPDFRHLAKVETRGVVVTCRSSDPAYDFVSRFFAPAVGVDEDPVTGSAHCALAPYWFHQLGRRDLVGYQASRRGGVVRVSYHEPRVKLSGKAVIVVRGTLDA